MVHPATSDNHSVAGEPTCKIKNAVSGDGQTVMVLKCDELLVSYAGNLPSEGVSHPGASNEDDLVHSIHLNNTRSSHVTRTDINQTLQEISQSCSSSSRSSRDAVDKYMRNLVSQASSCVSPKLPKQNEHVIPVQNISVLAQGRPVSRTDTSPRTTFTKISPYASPSPGSTSYSSSFVEEAFRSNQFLTSLTESGVPSDELLLDSHV